MPRGKQQLMMRKPAVEFTPERKERFLLLLREHGLQVVCAEMVGVTARCVQDHVQRDPAFADEYREAFDYWTETQVERAMIKRGIEGWTEPVIGGQFKDEIVTHVQKFSDACLLALGRARKPVYNKGAGADDGPGGVAGGTGTGGGVLVVPQCGHSVVEWEQLYGEKAKGLTGRPA